MSGNKIAYFRKAALKYIRGDIKELLSSSNLTCAGPLLSVTVNGIDLMGGICFSFNKGSHVRSVEYMTKYMNIDKYVANALYVGVRCGVAHQGMPKIGFNFFLLNHRYEPGNIIYKGNDGNLFLNVTELAFSFLDSLQLIEKDPQNHVHYYPPLTIKDEESYANAVLAVTRDIQDLCTEIGIQTEAEKQTKFERGEISEISSSSAYFPDNTLNVTLKIDPITETKEET